MWSFAVLFLLCVCVCDLFLYVHGAEIVKKPLVTVAAAAGAVTGSLCEVSVSGSPKRSL